MLSPICAVRKVTVFRDGNHNPGATISTSVNSAMRAPYGLTILDNCVTCPVREEHLFCNLPPPAVKKLNEIKSTAIYPKSTMLFIEGQQPRGVFVLCTGKAKLSTSSSEVREIAAFLVIEESSSQRYYPNQADAYARGNRGNDWHHARDGESLVLRLQEETIAPTEGLHFDCSQQTCARENGSSVTTVLEAASSGVKCGDPKTKSLRRMVAKNALARQAIQQKNTVCGSVCHEACTASRSW